MNNGADGRNRTALWLVAVIVTMGSLAWAAVPFYSWFCRVTGYGGTTNVAKAAPTDILDQTITVRFDANTDRGMPWEFKPVQREMTLRIGETGMAFFEAYNPTDHVIGGSASYNVAPDQAGYYFNKIQCFCFTEQKLEPGESMEMPVSFFVDTAFATDRNVNVFTDLTLSYTFYPAKDARTGVAAGKPPGSKG